MTTKETPPVDSKPDSPLSENIEKDETIQVQESQGPQRSNRDLAFWMVFVAGWACDMLSALDFVSISSFFFGLKLTRYPDCSFDRSTNNC